MSTTEQKRDFGFQLLTTEQKQESSSPSSSSKRELGFKFRPNPTTSSPTNEEEKVEEKEEEGDLFDYFDPLMSPHAYPDGIKSKQVSMSSTTTTPPPLEIVDDEKHSTSSSSTNSPSSNRKKKVGVLLMDHGSRKEKSNARLQAMAKLYQLTLGGVDDDDEDDKTPTIIVRAAHMEIATPSIHDGLKALKDFGVDEIICHPFFLSADGRHVKEDIPQIIGEATEALWGEHTDATAIPIVTTAPVGSNTQLMLGAIHSLVRENSQYLKTTLQNNQ